MQNDCLVYVDANKKPGFWGLKEIWAYRDLIALFTKRTFKITYKQTVLGPLWLIISPLLTSIIYSIVFGRIAKLSTNGIPHLLFYLSSHALWAFFSNCISQNAVAFVTNAHLYGKVYFPRLTLPISNVLASMIQLAIQMSVITVVIIIYMVQGAVHPNWVMILLIIPVVLLVAVMGFGVGIIISGMTTKYRDLTFLVGFGITLWMYASPVIYPYSQLGPGILQTLMRFNPMTMPMELFRLILTGKGTVDPVSCVSSILFACLFLTLGLLVFRRVERTFVDTI